MEIGVVIPTLNERQNIEPLLTQILAADERLQPIIIDDGSADGTAEAVKAMAAERGDGRIHLIERGRKLGFASALQDGMRYALKHDARLILQMDADFSHDPKYLPQILELSKTRDLVIGSRYVPGGGTENWGLDRKFLSGGANLMARLLLGLPVRDSTAGYRCWHRELLEKAGVLDLQLQGYAFQFVAIDRCRRVGATFGEVPIIFVDRQYGKSKMSRSIVIEAMRVLLTLGFKRLTGNGGGSPGASNS